MQSFEESKIKTTHNYSKKYNLNYKEKFKLGLKNLPIKKLSIKAWIINYWLCPCCNYKNPLLFDLIIINSLLRVFFTIVHLTVNTKQYGTEDPSLQSTKATDTGIKSKHISIFKKCCNLMNRYNYFNILIHSFI